LHQMAGEQAGPRIRTRGRPQGRPRDRVKKYWPGDAPRGLVVVVAAGAAAAVAAAAILLQAVEQAASRPGSGLGHAAEDPDQRVLGPVPRFLVGLGGVPDLVADRGAGVVVPARVVAAEDPLVLAVGGPVVELGEPDHRERMCGALQL